MVKNEEHENSNKELFGFIAILLIALAIFFYLGTVVQKIGDAPNMYTSSFDAGLNKMVINNQAGDTFVQIKMHELECIVQADQENANNSNVTA